ncbi:MAG: serine hydrolase [Pyrinomonadaceae bacterium]
MNGIICKILIFAFIFPIAAEGQATSPERIARFERGLLPPVRVKGDVPWTLEERMKHHKVPGVSIAVFNDFKITWAKAYGVADNETKAAATTKTLFQAGSISKPVAAMVALKKVQEGKILLDRNINEKLTSWQVPDNEFTDKKKVTLANLLSHTAGLTVHGFPGYAVGKNLPTLPQVLDGVEPANTGPVRVNMEPGTKFRYSGGGTTVAQLAIMDIEKKPFPQIADETVLKPLRMTNSTYSQPLTAEWRKGAATGHLRNGQMVDGRIHVYPEMAAAGLWTTPTDLAKFAIEVQLSAAGRSNKVLTKEMTAKMVTPFMEEVGLGFFIETHQKTVYFGHGGADQGFRAQLIVNRDKGYGAVVMVNSDNGGILSEIVDGLAQEYGWEEFLPAPYEVVRLTEKNLGGFAGRYRVNSDLALTVTRGDGRLSVRVSDGTNFDLFPISESTFIRKDAEIEYSFLGTTGASNSIKIRSQGSSTEAQRTEAGAMIPHELLLAGKIDQAIADYRKIKIGASDNIAISEGRLNGLGYSLLGQKKLSEAIAVFRLNVEFYPMSANAYDSLGEGYMENGDKELAIQNYKKALELDPKNTNALEILKKLEVK